MIDCLLMAILYSTQTWEREADESSAALNLRYVFCGHRPKHLIANDYENDKLKKISLRMCHSK